VRELAKRPSQSSANAIPVAIFGRRQARRGALQLGATWDQFDLRPDAGPSQRPSPSRRRITSCRRLGRRSQSSGLPSVPRTMVREAIEQHNSAVCLETLREAEQSDRELIEVWANKHSRPTASEVAKSSLSAAIERSPTSRTCLASHRLTPCKGFPEHWQTSQLDLQSGPFLWRRITIAYALCAAPMDLRRAWRQHRDKSHNRHGRREGGICASHGRHSDAVFPSATT